MLSHEQQQAAYASAAPQLILAGAGSGKTRTLVHRIAYLIAEQGIAPHRLLVVTFSNKAARELRQRLHELIGDASVISGTFHAVSLRFLRPYLTQLGFSPTAQVIDADDQRAVMKRLLKDKGICKDHVQASAVLFWIEQCKHQGLLPEQAPEEFLSGFSLKSLYADYQQSLRQHQRLDFNDLLIYSLQLLHSEPSASALRQRFDHVLVDEYQDTNKVQAQWLRALCQEHRRLTVVGDDDQSIYAWRGADCRYILEFQQDWPEAEVHRLETNYRSTKAILDLANAVIAANTQRYKKSLKAAAGQGCLPQWTVCVDEHDEARQIAAVFQQRHQAGLPWQEMAVLYRSNRQSLALEQTFKKQALPYRLLGSLPFFARKEIKDALAYWALLHRSADALQLLRICNHPRRGLGAKGQADLLHAVQQSDLTVDQWLDAQIAQPVKGYAKKIQPLAACLQAVRQHAEDDEDAGLWRLLDACAYLQALQAEGELEAQSRLEHLRLLQDLLKQACADGISPGEFLAQASLDPADTLDDAADAVQCMSLHRAKGLEFDTVWLAGIEDGLLPHQRSIDTGLDGIAEERRLLYVGITRAKRHLHLSCVRSRRMGQTNFPRPSRFLEGLNDALLHKQERLTQSPAQQAVASDWALGQLVRHPRFGEGTIVSMQGQGASLRVAVMFDEAGLKHLMLRYAALSIV